LVATIGKDPLDEREQTAHSLEHEQPPSRSWMLAG
jgi:hypothetical protein